MKIVGEYKSFVIKKGPQREDREFPEYFIINRSRNETIGTIEWQGLWKFCFYPERGTAWKRDHLNDIQSFMAKLTNERKQEKQPDASLKTEDIKSTASGKKGFSRFS